MGGEICYQKNYERGPWYKIQTVKDIIIWKESHNQDAGFERKLLKSWAKYEGYESAGEALRTLGKPVRSPLKE